MILISLISLIPCFMSLSRKNFSSFPNQSALTFYQFQLKELENELNHHLILPEAYQQAKLEIQRRILVSTDSKEKNHPLHLIFPTKNSNLFILCGLICIPLTSIGLYLINGVPVLPSQPLQVRLIEQKIQTKQLAPYVKQLKEKIASLNHEDPKRIEGYLLLGRIEAKQGQLNDAIQAWKTALNQHFDPNLAAQIAEMIIQENGHITKEAFNLFQQALQQASPNASWKNLAEERIIEYQKTTTN